MSRFKDKHFPYPEFNKGERGAGWKLVESPASATGSAQAWVEGVSRRIQVPTMGACPMCGKRHAASIRNHEQAHIRFTFDVRGRRPRMPKGLRDIYWQVAEDMRLDICILSTGVEQDQMICEFEAEKWSTNLENMDDKSRVVWFVAHDEGTAEFAEKVMREGVKRNPGSLDADQIVRIRDQAMRLMMNNVTSQRVRVFYPDGSEGWTSVTRPRMKNTFAVAWWLQNLLESLGVEEPVKLENPDEKGEVDDVDPNDPDEYDPTIDKPVAESEGAEDEDEGRDPADANPNEYVESNDWGDMVIEEVPLLIPIPGRLNQRWASTDEGVHMRSAHRWMTDQKIFVVRRRQPGGAVLVDCSGSMSLTQQQLLDILIGVPGALIATYNGNGSTEGTLRIVADKGRVCTEDNIKPQGGMNTIDGPALGWLGQQPGPRIWVSDGWVNGRGGATSENLYFDRDMLIAQHNINWIDPHVMGFENIVKATVDTLLRPSK